LVSERQGDGSHQNDCKAQNPSPADKDSFPLYADRVALRCIQLNDAAARFECQTMFTTAASFSPVANATTNTNTCSADKYQVAVTLRELVDVGVRLHV
jgi:hypothetical protein